MQNFMNFPKNYWVSIVFLVFGVIFLLDSNKLPPETGVLFLVLSAFMALAQFLRTQFLKNGLLLYVIAKCVCIVATVYTMISWW